MTSALRFIGMFGFLMLLSAFAAVTDSPLAIERAAGGLIQGRLEVALGDLRPDLDAHQRHALATETLARMQDPACDCRQALAVRPQAGVVRPAVAPVPAAEAAYLAVSRELLRDVRLYTGTNAALFLALLLVSARRRWAGLELLLPAAAVLTASLAGGWLFVSAPERFLTLIASDLAGLGYVAAVLVMLGDVAFNDGRLSGGLLEPFRRRRAPTGYATAW